MSLNLGDTDRQLEEDYQRYVSSGQNNDKTTNVILTAAIIAALVIPVLAIGYFALQSYLSHARLKNGTKTTAVIGNRYTEVKSSRKATEYEVSYTFPVDGKTYSGDGSLDAKPTSKSVTIVYDPADPSNNKIEGNKDFFEEIGETVLLAVVAGVAVTVFTALIKLSGRISFRRKKHLKTSDSGVSKPADKSATANKKEAAKPVDKLQLSSDNILWIEKELLKLNREIYGEDRPSDDSQFFQTFPKILLSKDRLTTADVAEAATELVRQTRKRIGKLEVPFRKPRVEFTSNLPNNEPGHIEFGEIETIIRIHPEYADDAFALASILCHELAHFVLDHNGLRKKHTGENEKLTDLFIFVCGQGLIHLQGIVDITSENGKTVESRLGYLTLSEMAYAHARCAAQHGLPDKQIAPDYFAGKVFEEVKKAIAFLQMKKDSSGSLAEIIICPNNHILRVSTERKSQIIRCPKCKWEKELWLHKDDQLQALIDRGIQEFNHGNYNKALNIFREAQSIERKHSMAYCWAARSLKKSGKKQDAIRELQKLLSLDPDDQIVQNEMKTLIYD